MSDLLYALSAVVLVLVVAASLVAVRRSQQGLDLDLELAAVGHLDTLVRPDRPAERSASSVAA